MGIETDIALRLAEARRAIGAAAERARRPRDSIGLVVVTKTVPWERIQGAWHAGARIFGESYVQEALAKVDRLDCDAEWHMIGHLQSNKAKQAVALFSLIQSLDRPSLADGLEKAARARGVKVDVLIQVNAGAEPTKSGTDPDGAVALAKRAREWPSLQIRGLMVIPPFCPDPEGVRPYFRAVRELRDRIQLERFSGVTMEILSMGMSSDFEVAIEEGATLVRIGTAIFGERGDVPTAETGSTGYPRPG